MPSLSAFVTVARSMLVFCYVYIAALLVSTCSEYQPKSDDMLSTLCVSRVCLWLLAAVVLLPICQLFILPQTLYIKQYVNL